MGVSLPTSKPKESQTVSDQMSTEKKVKRRKKKNNTTTMKFADHDLLRFSSRDGLLSWGCDGQGDDAISFSCDHDFLLVGFLLFGPSQFVRGSYYVRATVQDDEQNPVRGGQMSAEVDANPGEKYYTIHFRTPVKIQKMKRYTLVVNLRGNPTFQGMDGTNTIQLDDMTFRFFDTELSRNGTNVERGQIPGLVVNTE